MTRPAVYTQPSDAALDLESMLTQEANLVVLGSAAQAVHLPSYQSQVLSLNRRSKDDEAHENKKSFWRKLGRELYWSLQDPEGELVQVEATALYPVRLVVAYGFPTRGEGALDPINLSRMTKHLVDGLVDSGLAPDDSTLYVTGQDSRLLPGYTPRGRVWVQVACLGHQPDPYNHNWRY